MIYSWKRAGIQYNCGLTYIVTIDWPILAKLKGKLTKFKRYRFRFLDFHVHKDDEWFYKSSFFFLYFKCIVYFLSLHIDVVFEPMSLVKGHLSQISFSIDRPNLFPQLFPQTTPNIVVCTSPKISCFFTKVFLKFTKLNVYAE